MADLISMLSAASGTQGEATDPYFQNVVLLLHADGTNGKTNNSFLDSSTYNRTITRYLSATQGSFTPWSKPDGAWGAYFNGGSYLIVADNAVLRPGAGAFTLEAWVYRNVSDAAHTIYAKGGASTGIAFLITSGNALRFTDTISNISSTATIPNNTWTHVAVVREGTGTNQTKLYINGVNDGQGTVTTDFTQTEQVRIGTNRSAAEYFNGYISNVRFVKGAALYTGNFTPSSTPLTTTSQGASPSDVELLTCQSYSLKDNSSNNFTLTNGGANADIWVYQVVFSPFPVTSDYTTSISTVGGSFINTVGVGTAANWAFMHSANALWTAEWWMYRTGNNGGTVFATNAGFGNQVGVQFQTSGTNFQFRIGPHPGDFILPLDSGNVSLGQAINGWYHFYVAVNMALANSNALIYINGTLAATVNKSASPTSGSNPSTPLLLGAYTTTGTNALVGVISNFRLSDSIRTAPTPSTLPTGPYVADGNTILLLNATNAGIFDNSNTTAPSTIGDAQIDTTIKKYGTGSIEFDGTGDWLTAGDPTGGVSTGSLLFFTGNFTVEFWVYLNSAHTGANRGLVARGTSTTGWQISLNTTEKVVFTFGTSTITSSGSITTNAWNHIAVVREGTGTNQTKIYINGTNDGTGTVNTSFTQTNVFYIGANRVGAEPMRGFIDDLRVTKGIARYTSNFAPPTAAFPNIGD